MKGMSGVPEQILHLRFKLASAGVVRGGSLQQTVKGQEQTR